MSVFKSLYDLFTQADISGICFLRLERYGYQLFQCHNIISPCRPLLIEKVINFTLIYFAVNPFRFVWLVLVIFAFFGTLYVSYLLQIRYSTNMLATVVETTMFPVSLIPYPAVTICINKIDLPFPCL